MGEHLNLLNGNLYNFMIEAGDQSKHVCCCLHSKEITINIPNIRASTLYDFKGTIDFDQRTGYYITLVVPLKTMKII
jgi:hypothetical protein